MSYPHDDPRREAERLRIIVETLAFTNPGMTMDEAKEIIPKIEKATAKLEAPEKPNGFIHLPDTSPETAAKFIDLQPDIQGYLPHKKIWAIKELRGRTGLGLREAKEAVEHWDSTRNSFPTTPAPATPAYASGTAPSKELIADWIDSQAPVQALLPHKKIQAIKEVRMSCPYPCGLKEAKEGVEHWLDTRPMPLPTTP